MYNYGPEYIKILQSSTKNEFWKDVLSTLYEVRKLIFTKNDKENDTNFIYQEIWHNANIKVNNKDVSYKAWIDKGILNIHHLLKENGMLLSYQEFCEKYNFNTPFTTFYGLRKSILKKWPDLRTNTFEIMLPNYDEYIETIIKNKDKRVSVYDLFLSSVQPKQEYIDKWCSVLNIDKGNLSSEYSNKLPFLFTKDPKLCWFKYNAHR